VATNEVVRSAVRRDARCVRSGVRGSGHAAHDHLRTIVEVGAMRGGVVAAQRGSRVERGLGQADGRNTFPAITRSYAWLHIQTDQMRPRDSLQPTPLDCCTGRLSRWSAASRRAG